MLPTLSAPTRMTAQGMPPASKPQNTRSLRENSPGTSCAVVRFTLNSRPGHVEALAQLAGERHVDAVVVVRRQVDSRERAAGEGALPGGIAGEQRAQAVFVALGLQQPVGAERAGLAHRAVDRRDDGARIRVHGPRVRRAARA